MNKVQGIINLRKGYFEFIWDDKIHIISITCWEKAKYQNGEPLNINNNNILTNNENENNIPSNNNINDNNDDDEYETEDECEDTQEFVVIGNNNIPSILEVNNDQVSYKNITIDGYDHEMTKTFDSKYTKYWCNKKLGNCLPCAELKDTISCFIEKGDFT